MYLIFFFKYKSKLKSSPHDLSVLGHTRITTIKTTSFKKAIFRDLKKLSQYRVISETEVMKLKSLVTVNYYVMANYYNNFAHTAHHIRRVAILRERRLPFFFFLIKLFFKITRFFTVYCKHKNKKA